MGRARILLGQLGSYGDCLYATAIARQIKQDFPGCHLTWAIGSTYSSILDGNPHVDERWIVPMHGKSDIDVAWRQFAGEARRRRRKGLFTHIFLTQVAPDNFQNFDGTVRASLFNGYPYPITVPVPPVLCLSDREQENVRTFAQRHNLRDARYVVIFEFDPQSRQSFLDVDFAAATATEVVARVPGTVIIMSSARPFPPGHPALIDGSSLTIRETPALTHHAHLVAGCSSGISWACTAECARPLPSIQFLRRSSSVFASMAHDARRFGRPINQIVEMTECAPQEAAACIELCLTDGVDRARARYHEDIPVRLTMYFDVFMRATLRQRQPLKVLRSIGRVYERYGAGPLVEYLREKMLSRAEDNHRHQGNGATFP